MSFSDEGNDYRLHKLLCYNIKMIERSTASNNNKRKILIISRTHLKRHFTSLFAYMFATYIIISVVRLVDDIHTKYNNIHYTQRQKGATAK